MFDEDPFESADQIELEELSEAVRDEEAGAERVPSLPVLHEVIDVLAQKVADRDLVGVILFDASNLGVWERQHGAAAFDTVMGKLARVVDRMRGDVIRTEDEICHGAHGGDSVMVFLTKPRAQADRGPSVDFDDVINRIERELFQRADHGQLWLQEAFEQIATGSALIIHNSSVDPRREIYRAIRRSRSDAQVNHLEIQRQRHRVVGQMIAHRKIDTLYQPIVDLRTGQIVGYEALSRADQHDAERLGVHLFVAAAKAELDGELDQTCRSLSVHRRPGLEAGRKLFINCLPPTFYEPMNDLERLIEAWLSDGLRPDQLVFEVTENITQEQARRILPAVRRLRQRGFKFALDDMGTGTTNLRLLADLEPDYIKMDISLTRGIGKSERKQALARYLMELGQRCDAELIAEGIEEDLDRDVLVDVGFRLGQGFLLGRPQPRESIAADAANPAPAKG